MYDFNLAYVAPVYTHDCMCVIYISLSTYICKSCVYLWNVCMQCVYVCMYVCMVVVIQCYVVWCKVTDVEYLCIHARVHVYIYIYIY